MLRNGLKDRDETVRDAAIRSLASCGEAAAAADLLALARGAEGLTHRVLALRGYLGLVSAGGRPASERAQMCGAAWQAAARPDEKKLVLAELAKVPHADALALSEEAMKDEALAGEAEAACLAVAAALAPADPAAMEALRRIARSGRVEAHRKQAAAALKAAEKRAGSKGAASLDVQRSTLAVGRSPLRYEKQPTLNAQHPTPNVEGGGRPRGAEAGQAAEPDKPQPPAEPKRPDPKQLKEVLKEDDWNEYVIRCEGRRIRLWLNGLRTVDYTEADEKIPQEGIIGLQIHGGPPSEAWYKDLAIRVLGGEN
jgi:hypothetical protein